MPEMEDSGSPPPTTEGRATNERRDLREILEDRYEWRSREAWGNRPKNRIPGSKLARSRPFEVSNQGQATTVTAFGGFVDTGTTLTATPHIGDADSLRLDYDVTLSTFGPRSNPNLPPPRFQNSISGTVRVPDGHVVVLGGLLATRNQREEEGVPILMGGFRGTPDTAAIIRTSQEDHLVTTGMAVHPTVFRCMMRERSSTTSGAGKN